MQSRVDSLQREHMLLLRDKALLEGYVEEKDSQMSSLAERLSKTQAQLSVANVREQVVRIINTNFIIQEHITSLKSELYTVRSMAATEAQKQQTDTARVRELLAQMSSLERSRQQMQEAVNGNMQQLDVLNSSIARLEDLLSQERALV